MVGSSIRMISVIPDRQLLAVEETLTMSHVTPWSALMQSAAFGNAAHHAAPIFAAPPPAMAGHRCAPRRVGVIR